MAPAQVTNRPGECPKPAVSRVEPRDCPVPPPKALRFCRAAQRPKARPATLCGDTRSLSLSPAQDSSHSRLGPWILMGLVLRRAWEQFWQTQSFPLKVTLSPMGNGFLRPGRGGEWSAAHPPPRREPLLPWGQQGLLQRAHGSHSPAGAADKALGVVGPAQGGDDLAGDEVPAAVTAGPVELLVVVGADVLLVLEEETRLGQVAAAHWGRGHAAITGSLSRPCRLSSLPQVSPRLSQLWGLPRLHKMSVLGCGMGPLPAGIPLPGLEGAPALQRSCTTHPRLGTARASPPGPAAPAWGSAPPFGTPGVSGR